LIGVNLRGIVRNGFNEAANPSYSNQFIYDRRIDNYHRVDFRISFRKNRQKSSFIWALDIQNVTNRKNVAYHYYDTYAGKELVRYQLGIIPVLSFKLLM
jgi:hypothetical protein